jgi:glycerol-3-phosphate acyltransferase PlsY
MEIIATLFSYLLGSIPTGYIIGSLAGVDIREVGSGNIGATNVARVVGKKRGLLTLIADVTKGFLPVFVAARLGLSHTAVAVIGIAAFLGHLYPVFLKFHGGKGVATALGVLLALAPMATVVLLAVFGVFAITSRLVSLSSIAAALAAPIVLWFFAYPAIFIAMSAFLAVMIVVRHRGNIQRMLAGTEPRFGSRANSR